VLAIRVLHELRGHQGARADQPGIAAPGKDCSAVGRHGRLQAARVSDQLENFKADLASRNETGLAILDTFTAARRLRDIAKERYSEGLQ